MLGEKMSYEKIAKLAESLIVNTQAGKVKWKESTFDENTFEYSGPSSSITVSCQTRRDQHGEPEEDIVLKFYNDEGKLVESVSDVDLSSFIIDSYQYMKSLYETARRQALGVESILDNLLVSLPPVKASDSLLEQKKRKDENQKPAFPTRGMDDVPF